MGQKEMDMLATVWQTRTFVRQLERLRRADRKAMLAAYRAMEIGAMLRNGAAPLQQLRSKQTKYGELRLANCRKYDLGSGYRLITVQDDQCRILACAGSHDACHRWLENQRECTIDVNILQETGRLLPFESDQLTLPLQTEFLDITNDDPYESKLLARIDQDILRRIFHGLTGVAPIS